MAGKIKVVHCGESVDDILEGMKRCQISSIIDIPCIVDSIVSIFNRCGGQWAKTENGVYGFTFSCEDKNYFLSIWAAAQDERGLECEIVTGFPEKTAEPVMDIRQAYIITCVAASRPVKVKDARESAFAYALYISNGYSPDVAKTMIKTEEPNV